MKREDLLAYLLETLPASALSMFSARAEPSEVQKRMVAKWEAGEAERAKIADEIREWNKNVKRRNHRFVLRQRARGRYA